MQDKVVGNNGSLNLSTITSLPTMIHRKNNNTIEIPVSQVKQKPKLWTLIHYSYQKTLHLPNIIKFKWLPHKKGLQVRYTQPCFVMTKNFGLTLGGQIFKSYAYVFRSVMKRIGFWHCEFDGHLKGKKKQSL